MNQFSSPALLDGNSLQSVNVLRQQNGAELKRVLMLTHRFPYPPNRGDRIRAYHLLRMLAKNFHVSLACTSDEPIEAEHLRHVESLCQRVHVSELGSFSRYRNAVRSLMIGKSITEGMFYSPGLNAWVRDWHESEAFDLLFVFCSSMFQYADQLAFENVRTVVDLVDVDSEKWRQMSRESALPRRMLYRTEFNRVRRLECRIAERANVVTCVSDSEANLFRDVVTTSTPVHGVSNGVDTAYFQPSSVPGQPTDRPMIDPPMAGEIDEACQIGDVGDTKVHVSTPPMRLVFTGVLNYRPNVDGLLWFCNFVLPELRKSSLDGVMPVTLQIVGRTPVAAVMDLNKIDGVEVVGEVPDVRPHLRDADVAISPLQLARGIQNKVLEAMACGLPVIVTSESAEGIDAKSGQQFLIADTVAQWCGAVTTLANDASLRARIGAAARHLVASEYSWPSRLNSFTSLLLPIEKRES